MINGRCMLLYQLHVSHVHIHTVTISQYKAWCRSSFFFCFLTSLPGTLASSSSAISYSLPLTFLVLDSPTCTIRPSRHGLYCSRSASFSGEIRFLDINARLYQAHSAVDGLSRWQAHNCDFGYGAEKLSSDFMPLVTWPAWSWSSKISHCQVKEGWMGWRVPEWDTCIR